MKPSWEGLFARSRRDHSVFGSMLYMGDRLRYWESKTVFPLTGDHVEIFVDGSAEDKEFNVQAAFYAEICNRWPKLADVIFPTLRERLQMRYPDRADSAQFTVSSLSIPQNEFMSGEWSVSFETPLDPGHLYTVRMKGDKVIGVVLDG